MAMSRLDLLPAELRIEIFRLSMKAAFEEDMDNVQNQVERFDGKSLKRYQWDEHLEAIVNDYYEKPSVCLITSTTVISMYPAFHAIVDRSWRSATQVIRHRVIELQRAVDEALRAVEGSDDPERRADDAARLNEAVIAWIPLARMEGLFGWERDAPLRHIRGTAERIDARVGDDGSFGAPCSAKHHKPRRHDLVSRHYLAGIRAKRWTRLSRSSSRNLLDGYTCREYRRRWLRTQERLEEHRAMCGKCGARQEKRGRYPSPCRWMKCALAAGAHMGVSVEVKRRARRAPA